GGGALLDTGNGSAVQLSVHSEEIPHTSSRRSVDGRSSVATRGLAARAACPARAARGWLCADFAHLPGSGKPGRTGHRVEKKVPAPLPTGPALAGDTCVSAHQPSTIRLEGHPPFRPPKPIQSGTVGKVQYTRELEDREGGNDPQLPDDQK